MVDMKANENELLNFIIKHFNSDAKWQEIDIDILDFIESKNEKGIQVLYNVLDSDKFIEYAKEKDVRYFFCNAYGYTLTIYKYRESINLGKNSYRTSIKESKKGCSENGMQYIYEYANKDEFSPVGDRLYILNSSKNIENIKKYLRKKMIPFLYGYKHIDVGINYPIEDIFEDLLSL